MFVDKERVRDSWFVFVGVVRDCGRGFVFVYVFVDKERVRDSWFVFVGVVRDRGRGQKEGAER
ncbi:MAG: hypothetical protein JRJ26_16010 [Deltaproteobacteria bacterium]|nr:hypothetical protein [Deltaproteobacteria bacterium]